MMRQGPVRAFLGNPAALKSLSEGQRVEFVVKQGAKAAGGGNPSAQKPHRKKAAALRRGFFSRVGRVFEWQYRPTRLLQTSSSGMGEA